MIYTDSTFRLDATPVINSVRLSAFRIRAMAIAIIATNTLLASNAIFATAAWAQEENSTSDSSGTSWRDSTIARCIQQYSAEQCQDSEFLETNFHVKTLEIAHRTATQRSEQEKKALRELTLQRVCPFPASDVCANDANAALCAVQIAQACAMLKAEADNCVRNSLAACNADRNACSQRQIALCPSLKKQPIAQLLAKYPRLTDTQKAHLVATAAEIDAKTSGWWSNLVAWLKTPFR